MLNKERQRADDAEARLQSERQRNDQEREQQRERYERLTDELRDELRKERRQANEERRQFAASQQAMMNTLSEISATLARLAEQQQNGHRSSGD